MASKIKWFGNKVLKKIEKDAENNMERACIFLEGEIKKSMKTGTGRTYKRKSVTHTASAPGQPPAVDLGTYRQSITHEVKKKGKLIVGRVGTNMKRGKWLEFGTRHMAPRPHFRPGFNKNLQILKKIIAGKA